jgi:hypothetical protein
MYISRQIREDEIDGIYKIYGGLEKCIHNFSLKIRKKRPHGNFSLNERTK